MILRFIHEDSEDSVTSKLLRFILDNLVKDVELFKVEGLGGWPNVVDFVDSYEYSSNEVVIIMMDNVHDSRTIADRFVWICKESKKYNNMYVANNLCIEYILLCCNRLFDIIKPKAVNAIFENLMTIREEFINTVSLKQPWYENEVVYAYVYNKKKKQFSKDKPPFYTSENVAAMLARDLLNASSAKFTIDKVTLGECWTCDCCGVRRRCKLNNYDYNNPVDFTSRDKAICWLAETKLAEVIHDVRVMVDKLNKH